MEFPGKGALLDNRVRHVVIIVRPHGILIFLTFREGSKVSIEACCGIVALIGCGCGGDRM